MSMRKLWSSATGIGDAASVFVILILATLYFATWARAQTQPPPCMPFEQFRETFMTPHKEELVGLGPVDQSTTVMLFASAAGSWTIIKVDTHGTACGMAAGN